MIRNSDFYGKLARGMMALSTLSPALALIGIKGIGTDVTFCSPFMFQLFCIAGSISFGVLLPWCILKWVESQGARKTLEDMKVSEAGDHMIVYAVAVVLPLWAGETGSNQELVATGCAFGLVWFLIASSNLHHANLYLRLRGYRFYLAAPQASVDGTSFLVLSERDISGEKTRLFCSIIDGKLLVAKSS